MSTKQESLEVGVLEVVSVHTSACQARALRAYTIIYATNAAHIPEYSHVALASG